MLALALIGLVPVILWLTQTALLRYHGLAMRWQLNTENTPPSIRVACRVTTQIALASVIAAYPLLRGQSPLDYYAALLPAKSAVRLLPHGAAAAVLCLSVLYIAWLLGDGIRIDVHHGRRRWIRRLALLPATALFGAAVEELLFRGVLLADLLRTLPPVPAVAIGAAVFAGAHYVRKVKRRWTITGHIVLGVLFCVAFLRTRTLWLPMGLHAGGIFMIMGARPFVRYRGPAWITGASVYPYSGAIGLIALLILTIFVSTYYSG